MGFSPRRQKWSCPGLALALVVHVGCSLDYLPLGAESDAGCEGGTFESPTVVGEVSDLDFDDWAPAVSADERVMVFGSWRPGGAGGSDLWIATRSDNKQPFGPPEPITELNMTGFESGPSLSGDGLTICFESDRPGGKGMADLYMATRPGTASPFGTAVAISAVNTSEWESNCELDSAGLSIVFRGGPAAGGGGNDLWTASRKSLSEPFGTPVPLEGADVNTGDHEDQPSLSADGLELYFASDRPGGRGGQDIYVARRSTVSGPFGAAVNLTTLNSSGDDVHPALSRDGRRLYLNHNADYSGGKPAAKIWVARRKCGP